MIAYNLSYETLLRHRDDELRYRLDEDRVQIFNEGSPTETRFVRASGDRKRGFLPTIILKLLEARKRVKKAMKLTHDPVKRSILNSKQLAIKISCNSIYGKLFP